MQKTFCLAAACPVPQFPHQEKGERVTLRGSSLPHSGVQTPGVPPKSPQMQSASLQGHLERFQAFTGMGWDWLLATTGTG